MRLWRLATAYRGYKMDYAITTVAQMRQAFWNDHHFVRHAGWTQNQYPTDVRVAWVDFVDYLARDGRISEPLAQRATL